ncbi:ankyrin repeat domain-containing protein [Endozoicomonas sp. 8E]|uniref:ankyrin repeat domain-containing protein n=1 Tax=Endozoicomonas sp. 8E TaxID=3035692 RepID=UPI002938DFA2|nr:ankyrin repeat domain-containing protein [Endozoicomonas sp. 8E]WOG26644.1 ankyrin repeat domain-containing protein [Endozoicomonas sp. 8E]
MDISSHTFSMANLKQLILESRSFCDDSTRKINNLTEGNFSQECGICFKGVFGSHNVVVAHVEWYFFESTNPKLHFFHGSCSRELEATRQSLYSRGICPICQDYLAPKLEFSSVAHAVVSGEIDQALELMEHEGPGSKHSWQEAKMSALHIAAIKGDQNIARLLAEDPDTDEDIEPDEGIGVAEELDIGEDIDVQDSKGNTALHYAVSNHNLETVRTLLDFNAGMNIRNECGRTPLHLAAEKPECPDLFTLLMEHGARFDIPDADGHRAIHIAVDADHELALETLIKNRADVNATAHDGRTALHYAMVFGLHQSYPKKKNHLGLVRMLINAGAKVELRTGLGYTAFDGIKYIGNSSGREEIIKVLLSSAINSFADINAPAGHSGRDPGRNLLEYALIAKDKEALQQLIDRGAQVTDRNRDKVDSILNDHKDK